MAYTDFERLSANVSGAGSMVGTTESGLPVLHSGLANPLTGAGTHCRYNRIDGGGVIDTGNLWCIKSAVQSGNFVDVPSTKGVEIIFSARGTLNNAAMGNGTSVGVFVKQDDLGKANTFGFLGNSSGGEGFFGYGMRLGNVSNYGSGSGAIHAGIWARNTSTGLQSTVTTLPTIGAIAYDAWYTFKFTCIPSGVLQDTLTGYVLTGSDVADPSHFTEIAQLNVPDTSLSYVPWASATSRMGFYFSRGSPTNAGSANAAQHAWYIDRFIVNLKTV